MQLSLRFRFSDRDLVAILPVEVSVATLGELATGWPNVLSNMEGLAQIIISFELVERVDGRFWYGLKDACQALPLPFKLFIPTGHRIRTLRLSITGQSGLTESAIMGELPELVRPIVESATAKPLADTYSGYIGKDSVSGRLFFGQNMLL